MNIFCTATTLALLAYLLGSVPFGFIIVHLLIRKDIRQIGSGNIGTTNVRRAVGTKWALATLLCDVFKGLASTTAALYAISIYHQYYWLVPLTITSAVLGHMFPVFFGFKPSGKGVATTFGAFLIPAPWACLLALTTLVLTVKLSRKVSLGSLIGICSLTPAIWFSTIDVPLTIAALFLMAMVLSRHRENLKRMANGTEPALGNPQKGKY